MKISKQKNMIRFLILIIFLFGKMGTMMEAQILADRKAKWSHPKTEIENEPSCFVQTKYEGKIFEENKKCPRMNLHDISILEGKITDGTTNEELIGAKITIMKNGVLTKETSTNIEGYFSILLDPGIYELEANYTGYKIFKRERVVTQAGQLTKLNIDLKFDERKYLETIQPLICRKTPLAKQDETTTGQHIRRAENTLENLPTRDIKEMIILTAGTTFQ